MNNILTQEALMILLPSLAVSLVLGCMAITYWLCRRRSMSKKPKGGQPMLANDARNQEGSIFSQVT